MGTRGCYGFHSGEKDKLTYNHSDSYPTYLGFNILSFVHNTPESELRAVADRIELVDEDSAPSPEQIETFKGYSDVSVGTQTLTDWYCLLRQTQGDLAPYRDGLRHMIDSHDFLKGSLFCEWAYIINVDTLELEIYKGFNTRKYVKNGGRYAKYCLDEKPVCGKKYYGVTLLATLKLSDIRTMTLEEIKVFCSATEESVYNRNN